MPGGELEASQTPTGRGRVRPRDWGHFLLILVPLLLYGARCIPFWLLVILALVLVAVQYHQKGCPLSTGSTPARRWRPGGRRWWDKGQGDWTEWLYAGRSKGGEFLVAVLTGVFLLGVGGLFRYITDRADEKWQLHWLWDWIPFC